METKYEYKEIFSTDVDDFNKQVAQALQEGWDRDSWAEVGVIVENNEVAFKMGMTRVKVKKLFSWFPRKEKWVIDYSELRTESILVLTDSGSQKDIFKTIAKHTERTNSLRESGYSRVSITGTKKRGCIDVGSEVWCISLMEKE